MTSQSRNQEQSKQLTVSKQDMMQEYPINKQMEPECVNTLGYLDKGTGQHQSNTVYDSNGLSPTEYSVQYKDPFKVVECQKIKE